MNKTALLLVSIALTSGSTFAQQPKKARPATAAGSTNAPEKAKWESEPTIVMGVELGKPITLPECTMELRKANATCVYPPLYPGAQTQMIAGLGLDEVTQLQLFDGKVMSINVEVAHFNYGKLKSMLIQRYGQPQGQTTNAVQTRAGATFDSEQLDWIGKHVGIGLLERAGSIDKSMAFIRSEDLYDAKKAGEAAATSERANKF